jgi:hypothetical protein
VTPLGRPGPPPKPTVEALNTAIRVSVSPAATEGVSTYHLECSDDGGTTWPADADVPPDSPTTSVANLTNGVGYVCRAFARNGTGVSDASPLSDTVRPCSSLIDCSGLFVPVLGGLAALLVGGLLVAILALVRGRTRGYVVAVVDVVHTANIGSGSKLGIAFERDATGRVTGIVADRSSTADVRIRRLRGERFVITDRTGKHDGADGQAIVVADSKGARHSIVLHAFDTAPASSVASRH